MNRLWTGLFQLLEASNLKINHDTSNESRAHTSQQQHKFEMLNLSGASSAVTLFFVRLI